MKRVLFLTYYVPPRAAVASVRTGQLLDVLPRYGWEVVPVTPDLGDVQYDSYVRTTGVVDFKAPVKRLFGVNRTQNSHERFGITESMVDARRTLLQRAIHLGHDVTEYANRCFGWVAPGVKAVNELLRSERFDAVISTSPPESVHLVAARSHGDLPWIADFRDPWQRAGMRARPAMFTAMDRMLEPHTLRSASALTTVSEPLAQALRERYPHTPVYSIPNAFSASDFDGIEFTEPQKCTLLYAGQLYGGRCDPRPLFSAVSQLLHDGVVRPDELTLDFYGDNNEWLQSEVRRAGIASVITLHGRKPRQEILRLERAASRLLLFLWNDPNERGTYTGKLFEYLGARRRIIAIGGPDETVIDDALRDSHAGERYRTVAGLRDAVAQAVSEWRARRTLVLPSEAVAHYEADHLGRQFAEILERATSRLALSHR
jgi:glycosyltransferase involved in cell wall biosynthesis